MNVVKFAMMVFFKSQIQTVPIFYTVDYKGNVIPSHARCGSEGG